MSERASDAALEQVDGVLRHHRLENFQAVFHLTQCVQRVIKQNLFISLGIVVWLVSFALLGKFLLTLGVVGCEGRTVVVVMNSLRLLTPNSNLPAPEKLQAPSSQRRDARRVLEVEV